MTQHERKARVAGDGKAGIGPWAWGTMPDLGKLADFGVWEQGCAQALENYLQSGAALMQGSMDIGKDMLEFSQGRLKTNISQMSTLAGCKNPTEILDCQRHSAEEAMNQYLEEANKITAQMTEIMRDSVSRLLNHPPAAA